MMEGMFTKGPWTQDDSHGRRFIERVGTGDIVAIVCKVDGKNGYIAMNANSALIASAPDLLVALQDLFSSGLETCMRYDGKDDQLAAVEKAKSAIRKALNQDDDGIPL